MPSTAWSIGASSKTMLAALPPSSSGQPLAGAGQRALDLLAHLGRAGERDLVDAGVARRARRPVSPAPGDDVDHARRQVGLLADLGEGQRGERRGLGRLQHDGVAARQRRRDLPRQHQQREVPRDDLPGTRRAAAGRGRARRRPACRPSRRSRRSGRPTSGRSTSRDLLDRLAVVDASRARPARASAPGWCGRCGRGTWPAPPRSEPAQPRCGPAGGGHGGVDVGRPGRGHLGQHLLGGRVRRS